MCVWFSVHRFNVADVEDHFDGAGVVLVVGLWRDVDRVNCAIKHVHQVTITINPTTTLFHFGRARYTAALQPS